MKRDRRHRRPLAVLHLVIAATGRAAASTVPIDVCERGVLNPIFSQSAMRVVEDGDVAGATTGEWMRLYRFDMPEGRRCGRGHRDRCNRVELRDFGGAASLSSTRSSPTPP